MGLGICVKCQPTFAVSRSDPIDQTGAASAGGGVNNTLKFGARIMPDGMEQSLVETAKVRPEFERSKEFWAKRRIRAGGQPFQSPRMICWGLEGLKASVSVSGVNIKASVSVSGVRFSKWRPFQLMASVFHVGRPANKILCTKRPQ